MDYVVDHHEQEVAAPTADTENQFAGDEHKKQYLKSWISTLKDYIVVMGYQYESVVIIEYVE